MPTHKLTPLFVEKAAAVTGTDGRPRTTIYWDVELKGFGLVVQASGKKSWCVQYRAARRSKRMKISGVLGLREARQEAKRLLGEVALGRSPLDERRRAAKRPDSK